MITTRPTVTKETTHCPVCGGLQCLCRPRFFAGQLLTEEDLNRLERYIIEKNKLHNRYLHGWGVVCGLEVVCHACEGWVTVRSGYALSPCGDDIVVCEDEAVNVCALIKQCQDQIQKQWDCDPAWPRPAPICGDENEPWVLYVCYDEKPSRGVMPLRGASGGACCSRCSCGGSSGCGCGCHEKTNGSSKAACRPARPKTPAQCEPTITCEGYTFKVRKLRRIPGTRDLGEMANRIIECIRDLAKIQQAVNPLGFSAQLQSDIAAIKEALIDFMDRHGIHHCDLYKRLTQTPTADATGTVPIVAIQQHFQLIILELLRECICSAMLPACPPPAEDNCVPIATLTVNCKDGCRIVSVCNWQERRIVLTFPTLEYWFKAVLTQSGVAEALANICCGPIQLPQPQEPIPGTAVPVTPAVGGAGGPVTPGASAPAATGGVGDFFVKNLLDEAVSNQGRVKRSSVYNQLGSILKDLFSRLTKD